MICELSTVAPIEFCTGKKLRLFYDYVLGKHYQLLDIPIFKKTYLELAPKDLNEILAISLEASSKLFVAFYSTSVVLVLTKEVICKDYLERVQKVIILKNALHKQILSAAKTGFEELDNMLSRAQNILMRKPVSYAFSFSTIFDREHSLASNKYINLLAEPSLIKSDDMLSEESLSEINDLGDNLNLIHDDDLSSHTSTYVTWSSIVSVTKTNMIDYETTKYSLIALELKVQNIWNKCYYQNGLIDELVSKKVNNNLDNALIKAHEVLIESQTIISATISGRLLKIYNKILETSEMDVQIDKLRAKIQFLKVFINLMNQKSAKRNQKIFEILLLLVAIPTILEIFFELPLLNNSMVGFIAIVTIAILGIVVIYGK